MANIKSAEKRNRQRLRRRERNQHHLTTMRTQVKRARAAVEATPAKEEGKGKAQKGAVAKVNVTDVVKAAIRQIDKAAQKGVIARKAAARKISRLTLAVRRASA